MTTVADAARADVHALAPLTRTCVRVALLGVGQVGGAVATLLRESPLGQRFTIASGLVRDVSRERPSGAHLRLTSNVRHALRDGPDVVIEALGGLEPARSLVLEAISRRIPVVTANKSLLAVHGDELFDAAADRQVPLRYEAAVIAGVPFLGTFARRPFARDVAGLCGIVNGTTNFILSKMADERTGFVRALGDAQRLGYVEPDPANDVDGLDAVEKLCVLLRHFGGWSVRPEDIDTAGIAGIEEHDIRAAAEFDGALKPVVQADWHTGHLSAFAGPAFVSSCHPLARVHGVQNAVVLRNRIAGNLFFAGAGAGPMVTAATLLDDLAEIESGTVSEHSPITWKRCEPQAPATGWFIRLSGERLPAETEVADLLSAYGVWPRRASAGGARRTRQWLLTHPSDQPRIADALLALRGASGCQTFCLRVLED